MEDEFLSVADLAARYKLSAYTVRNVVVKVEGFPSPVRVGGVRRWRLSDVLDYEENSIVKARKVGRPRSRRPMTTPIRMLASARKGGTPNASDH